MKFQNILNLLNRTKLTVAYAVIIAQTTPIDSGDFLWSSENISAWLLASNLTPKLR